MKQSAEIIETITESGKTNLTEVKRPRKEVKDKKESK